MHKSLENGGLSSGIGNISSALHLFGVIYTPIINLITIILSFFIVFRHNRLEIMFVLVTSIGKN